MISKEELKKYTMPLTMTTFALIVFLVGLWVTTNKWAWGIGILFGLIMAILKLWLMENTFRKAVVMPEAKAKAYAQRHYMVRYLLTGAALFIAALEPTISLLGVFFGLCSMKVGAYMELVVGKK